MSFTFTPTTISTTIEIKPQAISTSNTLAKIKEFATALKLEIPETKKKDVAFEAVRAAIMEAWSHLVTEKEDIIEEIVGGAGGTPVNGLKRYAMLKGISIPARLSKKDDIYNYIIEYQKCKKITIKDDYVITLTKEAGDAILTREAIKAFISEDSINTKEVEDQIDALQLEMAKVLIKIKDVSVETSMDKITISKWSNAFPYNEIHHTNDQIIGRGESMAIENSEEREKRAILVDIDCITDSTVELINTLTRDHEMIFMSHKSETESESLLKQFGFATPHIEYKLPADNRSIYLIKEDMWRTVSKTHYIQAIIDTDVKSKEHAKRFNLTCLTI